jgi:hypothetical protein
MSTENRVSDVERELAHFDSIMTKLDQSVEKLTSISAEVTQLLAVHDNKLQYQEKAQDAFEKNLSKLDDKIVDSADTLHERINDAEKNFLTKISEQDKRIVGIQQWMWTAFGGGGAILFFLDKILPLFGVG